MKSTWIALAGVLAMAAPGGAMAGGPGSPTGSLGQAAHIGRALSAVDVGLTYVGPGVVNLGQTGTFTFKPFNTGPAQAISAMGINLNLYFPANFNFPVNVTAPNWTCTAFNTAAVLFTCAYTGSAVAAGSPLPQIVVTLKAVQKGGFANCARLNLNVATDANPGDNQSCVDGAVN